ncbi:MAG: SLBB domain-containing protein [Armatimonadia bacterium]
MVRANGPAFGRVMILLLALIPVVALSQTAPAPPAQPPAGKVIGPDNGVNLIPVPNPTPELGAPTVQPPEAQTQAPPQAAATPASAAALYTGLVRFGAEVFAGNRIIPMPTEQPQDVREPLGSPLANIPVSPDYLIGPADRLHVEIWSQNRQHATVEALVAADGYITLPVLGKVTVSGKTLAEVQDLIATQATKFYAQPRIVLELVRPRVTDAYVIGDVMQPGKFTLPGNATVFAALYAAGGPSDTGSYRKIRLLRNGQQDRVVDLYQFLMYGKRDADTLLQAGDTVFVPPAGIEIGVAGAVRRPARYELLDGATLQDAIDMASGFRRDAYAKSVEIWRPDQQRMWNLMLQADASTSAERGKLALADGDLVNVATLVEDLANTVELRGPVRRPGVYQVTPGLTVRKLVELAQGPTDKAHIQHATIQRLNDKFEYELIPFNLQDALSGKDDRTLQPRDIVTVYLKDEVLSSAVVSITGQVRKPGEYPFVEKMTVQELVLLAGDLLPGALTERAELLRVRPDQRLQIIPLNLVDAARGVAEANVVLQRGDTLNVLPRSSVVEDSLVHVDGFVRSPGSYARYEGMKASDAIMASGGLRPDAGSSVQYTPGRFSGASSSQLLAVKPTATGVSVEPDILLKDDDRLGVIGATDFTTVPPVAAIEGRVVKPGSYALNLGEPGKREGDTVYDLIQRADGLMEDANPKGIVVYRVRTELVSKDRMADLNQVLAMLNREVPGASGSVLSTSQQQDIMGQQVGRQVSKLLGTQDGAVLVTPPRMLSVGQWINAVPIDGAKLMASKGREGNLELHRGDIVRIPKKVDFVTVIGSVNSPGALQSMAGYPLDLVKEAGGPTPDANLGRMIVVRANGSASPATKDTLIEAGDVLIVPSEHMFKRVKTASTSILRDIVSLAAAALIF